MNKIVRENYPVARLPKDLRNGARPDATATVTVSLEERKKRIPTLKTIFASRRPPYRTKEEIDADIRRQRDEWDE